MNKNKWLTRIELDPHIVAKFIVDTGISVKENTIVYADKVKGLDDFGEDEEYYKVYVITKNGDIISFMSENTTSRVWYKSILI